MRGPLARKRPENQPSNIYDLPEIPLMGHASVGHPRGPHSPWAPVTLQNNIHVRPPSLLQWAPGSLGPASAIT